MASRSGLSRSLRPQVDSLIDLTGQAELGQRARSQFAQSGLRVLSARLVGLDGEGNPVGDARRVQDQLAACSLKLRWIAFSRRIG